jgi:sugar phosphate isomerase/epimerase
LRIGTKLERNYKGDSAVKEAFGEANPLEAIRELGMEFIEWPLSGEFDENEAWALAEECWKAGLSANFHPYLKGIHDTSNDGEEEGNACREMIRRYFAFVHGVAERQEKPCVLNLHPPASSYAVAELPHDQRRRLLTLRSLFFHRWADEEIDRMEWRVTLTAEVQEAAGEDIVRIGDSFRELLQCLGGIRHAGACWDMGHSAINALRFSEERYPTRPPDEFWAKVRHVHLHDVIDGEDHHPLRGGATTYRENLAGLRLAGFDGDVNLEIPVRKILKHGPYREVMAESVRKTKEAWDAAS